MKCRLRINGPALALAVLVSLAVGPGATIHAATGKPAAAPKKAATTRRPTAGRTNEACLGKAMGGLENIARVGTLYTRYELEIGGRKGTDTFWRDVRGAVRESLDVPGAVSEVVVFDGARGWRRGSNGMVLPLSGADLADRVTDAYVGSYMHLVPGRIPGTVERVGLDRATGLVKLSVRPQGGTPATLFLDTLTCLPARLAHSSGARAQTHYLRDWRTVSGIKLPYAIRRATADSTGDARLTLLEARFDGPLPAGAFAKPAPAAPQPVVTDGAR